MPGASARVRSTQIPSRSGWPGSRRGALIVGVVMVAVIGVVIAVAFYIFTASSPLAQPWLTVMAVLLAVYAVLGTIGIDALERFADRIETVTVDSVFNWLDRSGLAGRVQLVR